MRFSVGGDRPAGRGCGVGNCWPTRLARAFAVAVALGAFTTVQAQTVITLVSNTGQPMRVNTSVPATQSKAQQFRTGSHPGGYSLSSVDLQIVTFGGLSLDLCTVAGVSPTSGVF